MISLADLAALHAQNADALALPVTPVSVGDLTVGALSIGDGAPVLMGTVNLSRDSTYRDSVAVSTESAIRKARVQVAQGGRVPCAGDDGDALIALADGRADGLAHVRLALSLALVARRRVLTQRGHRLQDRLEQAVGVLALLDLAQVLELEVTGEIRAPRTARSWLAERLGNCVADTDRRMKLALDPHGLLNPGLVY